MKDWRVSNLENNGASIQLGPEWAGKSNSYFPAHILSKSHCAHIPYYSLLFVFVSISHYFFLATKFWSKCMESHFPAKHTTDLVIMPIRYAFCMTCNSLLRANRFQVENRLVVSWLLSTNSNKRQVATSLILTDLLHLIKLLTSLLQHVVKLTTFNCISVTF